MKKKWFSVRAYDYLPCRPLEFKIHGNNAELQEFGHYESGDKSQCTDKDIVKWGCYKRHFVTFPYEKNQLTAKRYGLTENEYRELTETLEDRFNIGTCGLCV